MLVCVEWEWVVPSWQVNQFGVQNPGLYAVERAIVAFKPMIIFLRLSVVPEHVDHFGKDAVVGSNCPGFSTGAKVLAGIKAESSSVSHGSGLSPPPFLLGKVFSTVRLTCILDHEQAVALRLLQNRVHIRPLTIKMHRNNCGYGPARFSIV